MVQGVKLLCVQWYRLLDLVRDGVLLGLLELLDKVYYSNYSSTRGLIPAPPPPSALDIDCYINCFLMLL